MKTIIALLLALFMLFGWLLMRTDIKKDAGKDETVHYETSIPYDRIEEEDTIPEHTCMDDRDSNGLCDTCGGVMSPILFSINEAGAGYGTLAQCTGALIYVQTDRKVRVLMQTEEAPQVAAFTLSQEDYQTLETLIQTMDLREEDIQEDHSVCDGNASYIILYDEAGHQAQKLGGYCPVNAEFWELYRTVKSILRSYGYQDAVEAFRDQMETW